LAAAAAHELGTPLSTITVIATDLERAIEPDSPHAEDIRLLREQAQRCRKILAKLTELSSNIEPFDQMPLSALVEEVVAPHRNFGIDIDVTLAPKDASEPIGGRNPAILYGLGNLVENAVDFARARVNVVANWSRDDVGVTITDDGPGFAPEILDRIGEPYVTSSRRRRFNVGGDAGGGLGLGFFIAKTLLERSGATLTYENRAAPARGAVVRVAWSRADFELNSAART
jgi:two-component system sensor histidine kinase RegB